MQLPAILFLSLTVLTVAPPKQVEQVEQIEQIGQGDPDTSPEGAGASYSSVLTNVRAATTAANIDPVVGAKQLEIALLQLLDYAPLLSSDPGGCELQIMGVLALARAALVREDQPAAILLMDRALTILAVSNQVVEGEQLGPRLAGLLAARRAELTHDSFSRLHAQFVTPDPRSRTVFVNGRQVDNALITGAGVPLAVGAHHIWIEEDGVPPVREVVVVERLGATIELDMPDMPSVVPPPKLSTPAQRDKLNLSAPVKRIAPRWSEITLVVAGTAVTGLGATLLVLDDRCTSSGPRRGPGACPRLYDFRTGGISTLAAGAAVVIGGSIMLAIDEARQRRSRHPR